VPILFLVCFEPIALDILDNKKYIFISVTKRKFKTHLVVVSLLALINHGSKTLKKNSYEENLLGTSFGEHLHS